MTNLQCIGCDLELRQDIALLDAKWFKFNDKGKYICRDCAKEIAKIVVEEY